MNEITKSRDSRKRVLGFMASLLACFALIMALVPVQAIASDAGDGGTPDAPVVAPGGDQNDDADSDDDAADPADSVDPTDPTDLVEVAIPNPASNLTYTGTAQKLLPKNAGYKIELVSGEGLATDIDDKTDKDAVLATKAGTYKFTITLNEGYAWPGGGKNVQTKEAVIDTADINKATTVKAPKYATLLGEPATIEIILADGNKKELKEGVDYKVEYNNNEAVGNARALITGIGNYKGWTTVDFEIVESQVMYRLYNPNSGEHFYTVDTKERDSLVKVGWKYEGEAWFAPKKSDTPVYRLYSGTDHHYTTSSAERDSLVKAGWKDEGIGWYSENFRAAEGATNVHVYRLFNPNVVPTAPTNNSGSHHYTVDSAERDSLVKIGWKNEGTGWYAAKTNTK